MVVASALPGISGTLFPGRYLASEAAAAHVALRGLAISQERFARWWARVADTCGPATGIRALFDHIAMPLFGMLGFRGRDACFEDRHCEVVLETSRGALVPLLLLPWAERPSSSLRGIYAHASEIGASWAFVLAPPNLSLLHFQGPSRRAVDFYLPAIARGDSFPVFAWLASSRSFDSSIESPLPVLDRVLARAETYRDEVRDDLQLGVLGAVSSFAKVVDRHGSSGAASHHDAAGSSLEAVSESLTLVYRVLFLLFVESRHLVPVSDPIYQRAYSVTSMCRDALRGTCDGLWEGLAATTRLSRMGCRTRVFQMAPFNGRLFARSAAPVLERRPRGRSLRRGAEYDEALREALVALGSRRGAGGREAISYAELGVEQLGAVYEQILDHVPVPVSVARPSPGLRRGSRHSAARKRTGTFYTPQALAEFLVRRTLGPLLEGRSSDSILDLRVVDPAMGSGAFLVAACRHLARAYEDALVDEGRASPSDFDDESRANVRRLVAERCLSGVDRNPTAVQLARLSLWLTTLARGKPLNFLDHRLRVGDSLVGAWPEDLWRVRTRAVRPAASLSLFDAAELGRSVREVTGPLNELLGRHDDTIADVRYKESFWKRFSSGSSPLAPWRMAASLWCARWFWAGGSVPPDEAETRAIFDAILRGDQSIAAARVRSRSDAASVVAGERHFFHWPLEFPDVFYRASDEASAASGFDVVLGNPPWEMLRRDESEGDEEPGRTLRYLRGSGHYPSCLRGHLNLYQAFLERSRAIAGRGARIGLVLPWGLASDEGAGGLRERLFGTCAVDTIVGLDNSRGLFPIHRGVRFMVLTATNGGSTSEVRARFGLKTMVEMEGLPGRVMDEADAYPVRVTPGQLRRLSGGSLRIPDLRRPGELAWAENLVAKFPRLGATDGWHVSFGRELNATGARPLLGQRGLPVIEGKHLSPFVVDVRAASSRIDKATVAGMLPQGRYLRPRLGYRDVSAVGNRFTLIAAVVPAGVVTTHTVLCVKEEIGIEPQHFLCALFNSYVLNALVRLFMGGHVTTALVESLPVPVWGGTKEERRIAALSARISSGGERGIQRAALQARVARVFGMSGEELDWLLEGFVLVPRAEKELIRRAFAKGEGVAGS